ncbi:Spy/CpxP family protein refolding chaperone [Rhizobium sp.]
MTEEIRTPEVEILPPEKRRWSRKLIIGSVAVAIAAGAGAYAYASNDGWGGRQKFMRGYMEYRLDQMLTEAGASDDQKSKVKTIVTTTIDEVRPEREARMAMRDEIIKLIEAPTIDRNAIESLRAKQMAQFEERSKAIAKAVVDAAEVLTPDQRKKLVEEMKDFAPHGRW